ncbi:hypothetical protein DSECCO2_242190 [anaerobic digester metagenome]|jgi:hypothetical protein
MDFNKLNKHKNKWETYSSHIILPLKSCVENEGFKQAILGNRRLARSSYIGDGDLSPDL